MLKLTYIHRTAKKEVILKMAEEKAKDHYNSIVKEDKDISSDPTDPEIRKLLGFPDTKEEDEEDVEFVMKFDSEDLELEDEDYDYFTKRTAIFEFQIENIIEFTWCTLIEKAGGDVLQVQESFEEVYEKLARYQNKQ